MRDNEPFLWTATEQELDLNPSKRREWTGVRRYWMGVHVTGPRVTKGKGSGWRMESPERRGKRGRNSKR